MDALEILFSSKGRAEMLKLLIGGEREFYFREIQRHTGLSVGSIQQEILRFKKMDLIQSRKDGNRLYFSANHSHPIYRDLKQIILKTSGWIDELRQVLRRKDVTVAFVFGSVARGEEKAGSDVDLMVVGSLGLRAVSAAIGPIARNVEREINPHVYTLEEFERRVKGKDHFITSVMDSAKLFVIGDEDELKGLG
jgi:predicted nucleotidyltransferase